MKKHVESPHFAIMNSDGLYYNTLFETWVKDIDESTEYTWSFAESMIAPNEYIVDLNDGTIWEI